MPIFHLRLTDTKTGEFRNVSVSASSKEEAEAIVLRQEQKKVDFQLDPTEAKDFEKRLKEGTLTGRDKARIFAHQQDAPYKIQRSKES